VGWGGAGSKALLVTSRCALSKCKILQIPMALLGIYNRKFKIALLCIWYGASLGGPLCCYTHNLTLRLFSHTCPHTMSYANQTRPQHTAQPTGQTTSPWWWNLLPLLRHDFDESMPLEGQAAFCNFCLRPLSNSFNRFIKLM
jgi:hypothetical protein